MHSGWLVWREFCGCPQDRSCDSCEKPVKRLSDTALRPWRAMRLLCLGYSRGCAGAQHPRPPCLCSPAWHKQWSIMFRGGASEATQPDVKAHLRAILAVLGGFEDGQELGVAAELKVLGLAACARPSPARPAWQPACCSCATAAAPLPCSPRSPWRCGPARQRSTLSHVRSASLLLPWRLSSSSSAHCTTITVAPAQALCHGIHNQEQMACMEGRSTVAMHCHSVACSAHIKV